MPTANAEDPCRCESTRGRVPLRPFFRRCPLVRSSPRRLPSACAEESSAISEIYPQLDPWPEAESGHNACNRVPPCSREVQGAVPYHARSKRILHCRICVRHDQELSHGKGTVGTRHCRMIRASAVTRCHCLIIDGGLSCGRQCPYARWCVLLICNIAYN